MNRQEAEQLLQKTFKLEHFYDEQWITIERLLRGERVLLIEKTGFGKSLCFQFPAIVFEGVTIIFSPLIALMRDQVKKLSALGIPAACINSEQDPEVNRQTIGDAKQGKIKVLYIAPERQENSEWIEATQQMNISMVVVDEAHCISVWGHDFRPAFRRIVSLVKLLRHGLPVLATTATATTRVEKDIAAQIAGNITTIRGNLLRSNLRLRVLKVSSEDEKLIWLGQNIASLEGSGILYTGTTVETEVYARWFEFLGISSVAYHSRLDADTRIAIEHGLMSNKWKCISSTNALGMGIDKPDIRFIIHSQIPQSPIHYYQEIGRAGRDGKLSDIILLFNPEDRDLPEAFIEGGRPNLKKYERVIAVVKEQLLGEKELMKKTNLKQNEIRVIKADLIEQGIVREISNGTKKYEYIVNSKPLDTVLFEELKKTKTAELDRMIEYVDNTESRMKYLCNYLGDKIEYDYKNCDNTGEPNLEVDVTEEWEQKLIKFRENYFPPLEVAGRYSNIINGVAASYYGVSNVGDALNRSKYKGSGDFPDFLLSLCLKAFRKKFGQEIFDLVLYIPPTTSGDLVKNFAIKLASVLKFPISHKLVKSRQTSQQKIFENHYLKAENVTGAFAYTDPEEIKGKSILLVDDICDSGATLKELGKYLTNLGAIKIAPIVIAKTVGGDLTK